MTYTKFLNLFKYDPVADAVQTFNIQRALNDNWDKISTWAAEIDALARAAATQEDLDALRAEMENLIKMISTDITDNAFEVTFTNLDGLAVTGVWNQFAAQVEC